MKSRLGYPQGIEHLRQIVEKQVQNISNIVDDLTDVAKIEFGKLALRRTTVDIGTVVKQAAQACNELISKKQQDLRLELPATPVFVLGDATRLEQIVCNLLQNAAKYTPELGTLSVWVEQRDKTCSIHVLDNGSGISAQLLPRIFDLFTQAPQSLDRPQGGLGLGLTIVRRLVDLHGGSISARSEGEGKGSEFIVRLPLTDTVKTPDQEQGNAQVISGAGEKRVLVVDDNVDIRETLQALVESWGHTIKLAAHANEALEILKAWKPNVILLDIGLPEINGFELAQQIRAVSEWNDTRLIAVTGYSGERERRMTLKAGFDHVMIKPVNLDKLLIECRTFTAKTYTGAHSYF